MRYSLFMKRKIADVKHEIKELKAAYDQKRFWLSSKRIEALTHIAWLEGYLQALQDERTKK